MGPGGPGPVWRSVPSHTPPTSASDRDRIPETQETRRPGKPGTRYRFPTTNSLVVLVTMSRTGQLRTGVLMTFYVTIPSLHLVSKVFSIHSILFSLYIYA